MLQGLQNRLGQAIVYWARATQNQNRIKSPSKFTSISSNVSLFVDTILI